MTPYYADDFVTIYHGDCREWMPNADVLITDPPYGIALDTRGGRPGQKAYPPIFGDDSPFDPEPFLRLGLPTALWGANHYADRLPVSRGWVVWDKVTRNDLNQKQAEVELAWTNFLTRPRAFRHMWMGGYRSSERGERYHPTQKPVALMAWLLRLAPDGLVLDPFMGSGSTLLAARSLGRHAVGVEIEERYCEVAANRCRQDVLGLSA